MFGDYDCAISPNPTGAVTVPSMLGGYPVTSIGECAFWGCSGLTSVTMPDSVTSIGDYAFRDCQSLKQLAVPESVTSYGVGCFDGTPALYRAAFGGSTGGGAQPSVTTIVQKVESPYALTNAPADRAIASVTVDDDCAIDEFVLKDGKVFDAVLRIVNTADRAVTLTLPSEYEYETFKGSRPLTIPAGSRNLLTITRTAAGTFLVSRRELESVQ